MMIGLDLPEVEEIEDSKALTHDQEIDSHDGSLVIGVINQTGIWSSS